MSLHPERIPDYIEHMAEALERVLEYTRGMSEAEFMAGRMVQDAVMRNLEILGEAANKCVKNLPTVAEKYPGIPFAQIYGLRNQLTHGYTTVDLDIVWDVVAHHVPELQMQVAAVLVGFNPATGSSI
jgi:uncharacterized protein with HEPN domain